VDESSRDGDYLHSELNARPFETFSVLWVSGNDSLRDGEVRATLDSWAEYYCQEGVLGTAKFSLKSVRRPGRRVDLPQSCGRPEAWLCCIGVQSVLAPCNRVENLLWPCVIKSFESQEERARHLTAPRPMPMITKTAGPAPCLTFSEAEHVTQRSHHRGVH
jgi:hypothetical protein